MGNNNMRRFLLIMLTVLLLAGCSAPLQTESVIPSDAAQQTESPEPIQPDMTELSRAMKRSVEQNLAIDFADMPENEDSKESFYEFYEHFANDSLFQQTRLHNPLKFVTVDPDDEFQIIETTLEAGQWFAFQPVLPREFLTNVNYGQNENSKSNTKVIEIKGFGNGFNNTLYFERRNGLWKLVQFEDLSD